VKHKTSITIILLSMFFITQLIGIFVIGAYLPRQSVQVINGTEQNVTITPQLPYGMQPPEMKPNDALSFLVSLIISFVFAIVLIFVLMRIKAALFIRIWFFVVVIIALGITITSFISLSPLRGLWYIPYISLLIALPLAIYKIFRRNIIVHNATELMIYPGIAAVFVPILNIWTILALLIIISLYDIYAVWHSKFMQKMAKFQINKLKLFTGFFVPYADKKTKDKIRLIRQRYKSKKIPDSVAKKQKFRISLAILGGGDVVFPIITAGVVMQYVLKKSLSMPLGIIGALLVSVFATLALLALFIFSKKGKFYPAMPFITAGCIIGMIVAIALARIVS